MLSEKQMPRGRHQRIQMLYEAAYDLPLAEQAPFVERACNGDAELERAVKAHLAAARASTDRRLHGLAQAVRAVNDDDTVLARPPQMSAGPAGPAAIPAVASASPDSLAAADLAAAPTPGTRIGQYELVRELGRGGMAVVFLARDIKLGRRVAMKFLRNNQPHLTRRFILEAQATARCTHENIVVIHDVKEHGSAPFMVLEYLKGQTLSALVKSGRMPPYRAVQLMTPVVRALMCAHEHKLVHRDLKPSNIYVTATGSIKVLDFGIAKLVRDRDMRALLSASGGANADLTATDERIQRPSPASLSSLPSWPELTSHGALVGTMPYMSPEQWNSEPVDHRTDLWAVGIMLYVMVVGRHPLEPLAGHQLMVTGILDQPMPSARDAGVDMPPALADVIDRCLQKRLSARMPTAEALLNELERLLPDRHGRELSRGESPYTGLSAFQEADADRFFGRSREIATLLTRLHDRALVGVVGPSGVGKSSFVRAGLIPALKRSGEKWEALVIRPGRHPTAALANILTPLLTGESATLSDQVERHQTVLNRVYQEPGYVGTVLRSRAQQRKRKIIVFVDQFEELFTLTPDIGERLVFTASLAAMADDAVSPLRVVLSIRSDFLDRVAEDREFMAELSQNLFFLLPPDRDGLRDALTRPAEMVRYRFETRAMVDQMLDNLQATPGALPLLQFAATKLWDARDTERRMLTEQGYQRIGGVVGVLASHADAVLSGLPGSEQALVRTIFLQLVTPEHTRAIASLDELCEAAASPGDVERLVRHLVDARLLVVQRGDSATGATVEIVHEALIHGWPRLREWLEENQEDRAILDQIRQAAKQWDGKGRPAGLLWRGEAAADAVRWLRRYRGTLGAVQQAYLEATMALSARTARRKRWLVAGTISFLSTLVVAAAVALVTIRDAEQRAAEQATLASAKADEAEAARVQIQSQFEALREKERQRQAEEERADAASDAAEMSASELRVVNRKLHVALDDAERSRSRTSKLLDETETARAQASRLLEDSELSKERLAVALREAEWAKEQATKAKEQTERAKQRLADALSEAKQAKKHAEAARDRERMRAERLEKQLGGTAGGSLQ
ncbi:protein kinase domain-containing protein [Haliangium sp.]|uniref:serine/threonine-protein kinase n=1 Tax=Haliangium sp. TaxID=2663208 RepID=UPI003D10960F